MYNCNNIFINKLVIIHTGEITDIKNYVIFKWKKQISYDNSKCILFLEIDPER